MKQKTTLLKTILLAAAMMLGGQAWAQTTRTWDFTDNSTWSTIAASTGTVYYATDGSTSTSTAFDASTAICMNVTNAFTYSTDHYSFGGYSTSTTSGSPDKDYMSVVVPAGYTLTVNGAVYYSNNYNNNLNIWVDDAVKVGNPTTTYMDIAYANNSGKSITAYIYTPSTESTRPSYIKSVTIKSGTETLTAITGNCYWDFTNRLYNATYDGATYDNIYFGSGAKQISNSKLKFSGTGNTSTGENTVQIKIPANKAIGLLVKMGGSEGRKSYISDRTDTLFTINSKYGGYETPVTIASSESERTLYFFNSNARDNQNYATIDYIYVYTQQSVNIGSTGWATLYTPCALDFSGVSGLKAYTASCSENTVTLTEVSNVTAGTGVILKGTPNTNYDIPVTGNSSTDKGHLEGKFLTATAWDAESGYTYYVLASVNDGKTVQFNPVTSGSIAAGKAFLKVASSSSARSLNVVFADETTGVADVKGKVSDVRSYYSLSGQRVFQPTKGLYIANGKKVIIK